MKTLELSEKEMSAVHAALFYFIHDERVKGFLGEKQIIQVLVQIEDKLDDLEPMWEETK